MNFVLTNHPSGAQRWPLAFPRSLAGCSEKGRHTSSCYLPICPGSGGTPGDRGAEPGWKRCTEPTARQPPHLGPSVGCISRLHSPQNPGPSSPARLCTQACEAPTSCLSVSLAMISLWSMRDSSSTSSSDCADSGPSGDFRALRDKWFVLQVPPGLAPRSGGEEAVPRGRGDRPEQAPSTATGSSQTSARRPQEPGHRGTFLLSLGDPAANRRLSKGPEKVPLVYLPQCWSVTPVKAHCVRSALKERNSIGQAGGTRVRVTSVPLPTSWLRAITEQKRKRGRPALVLGRWVSQETQTLKQAGPPGQRGSVEH